MDRNNIKRSFEKMGARLTIRKGTAPTAWRSGNVALRMNVANDRQGEHFTMTVHPKIDESDIVVQVLDYDSNLRQMLLFISSPRISDTWNKGKGVTLIDKRDRVNERLLVGRDEMHWFVAGVTVAKNIREAFALLRPQAVTVSMNRNGVKNKEWNKRKTKGFVRQGEWFFVPVNFQEDKTTVVHKNEPIRRQGGKPHFVEEVVRFGGETIYTRGDQILTSASFEKIPADERHFWRQQVRGARVLGRGKVKHPDHHTVILNGWHEIHLSTESGNISSNAFID